MYLATGKTGGGREEEVECYSWVICENSRSAAPVVLRCNGIVCIVSWLLRGVSHLEKVSNR